MMANSSAATSYQNVPSPRARVRTGTPRRKSSWARERFITKRTAFNHLDASIGIRRRKRSCLSGTKQPERRALLQAESIYRIVNCQSDVATSLRGCAVRVQALPGESMADRSNTDEDVIRYFEEGCRLIHKTSSGSERPRALPRGRASGGDDRRVVYDAGRAVRRHGHPLAKARGPSSPLGSLLELLGVGKSLRRLAGPRCRRRAGGWGHVSGWLWRDVLLVMACQVPAIRWRATTGLVSPSSTDPGRLRQAQTRGAGSLVTFPPRSYPTHIDPCDEAPMNGAYPVRAPRDRKHHTATLNGQVPH